MKIRIIFSDIYWVFWRELKKFLKQRPRIITAVVQPLVWLVFMGSSLAGLTRNPAAEKLLGTGSYLDFMVPGVMIMTALFGGVFGGISVVWDRRLGFLAKMLTAPIHRAAIPVGKLLALGVQIIFQALFIVLIALILGVHIRTGVAGIVSLLFLSCLFGLIMGGISLSIASVLKTLESFFAVTNFLTLPLMFTSSAMYPIGAMPGWLQTIAQFNPLSYAVGPMRTIATRGWIWQEIWPGVLALVVTVALTTSIAIRQYRRPVA
jgi:ABC-2 type transport system permease protein